MVVVTAWQAWCEANGRHSTLTSASFGVDLRALVSDLQNKQFRTPEGRVYTYVGVGLLAEEVSPALR